MSQRDKAEKRVHDKHGSASGYPSKGKAPHRPGGHSDGVNTEHRKAHNAAAKEARRARRRLDKEIVKEESPMPHLHGAEARTLVEEEDQRWLEEINKAVALSEDHEEDQNGEGIHTARRSGEEPA